VMRDVNLLCERSAHLKSQRDDVKVALGKRSAARGNGPKMIFSLFFQSGCPERLRGKPAWKKREIRWGGLLPGAAA
jgi:hypothetical protein